MQKLDIGGQSEKPKQADERLILHKFNWGAFFLTWIWAVGNKSLNRLTVLLLILCLVPYIGLFSAIGLSVYSGVTGNRRAWNHRHMWRDEAHFNKVQRRWAVVGATQFALVIVLLLLLPLYYEK